MTKERGEVRSSRRRKGRGRERTLKERRKEVRKMEYTVGKEEEKREEEE